MKQMLFLAVISAALCGCTTYTKMDPKPVKLKPTAVEDRYLGTKMPLEDDSMD